VATVRRLVEELVAIVRVTGLAPSFAVVTVRRFPKRSYRACM
jgi:hypothetical protein